MDQISGTTPTDAPIQAQEQSLPADSAPSSEHPGFRSRGRARRRVRFLRKARELAYRDLGGLVFNLHRFGQRNDALVLAKLTTLGHIDTELRALEDALEERLPVTVLREAGITACPRCAAIHGSEDSFCPNCGLSMDRHVDLPAGFQSAAGATGAGAAPVAAQPTASPQTAAPTAAPAAQPTAGPPAPAAAPTAAAAAAPPDPSVPAPTPDASLPSPPSPPSPGPPDPAGQPTPERALDATGTPAQPAPSASRGGRSPAPPSTSGIPSPTRPARAAQSSTEEDENTEILRPPVSGS